MKISRREIETAFEFVGSASPEEHTAAIDISTGKINWHSEYADDMDEPPEGLWESGHALAIPHKNDLDLGQRLIFEFVESRLPDDYGAVRDIFHRRGAYSHLKDLLDERGLLDAWYEYENGAEAKAIAEWCGAHGIELVD